MVKGFGLNDFSDANYDYEKYEDKSRLRNSIEKILKDIGYEKEIPLNFNTRTGGANIYGYSSPGEGGCVIRYGNEIKDTPDSGLYIGDKNGESHLVGANLTFIGATGSLIQRTKKAFEENADFPYFEF